MATWLMCVACCIRKFTRAQAPAYAHAHAPAYPHTKLLNTYCFFTATMVSRTRLNVTLYVHCPSSLNTSSLTQHIPRYQLLQTKVQKTTRILTLLPLLQGPPWVSHLYQARVHLPRSLNPFLFKVTPAPKPWQYWPIRLLRSAPVSFWLSI
jgi:hypothetical protein